MTDTNPEQFNAYEFIDELIAEMGMQHEDPTTLEELKANMLEALTRQIFEAAAENLEAEVADMVMEAMKDETDASTLFRELIQASPTVQVALVLTIDQFRENTLEAFHKLNK